MAKKKRQPQLTEGEKRVVKLLAQETDPNGAMQRVATSHPELKEEIQSYCQKVGIATPVFPGAPRPRRTSMPALPL